MQVRHFLSFLSLDFPLEKLGSLEPEGTRPSWVSRKTLKPR